MNSWTNNHGGCENVDKISLRSSLPMEGNELGCSKTGPTPNPTVIWYRLRMTLHLCCAFLRKSCRLSPRADGGRASSCTGARTRTDAGTAAFKDLLCLRKTKNTGIKVGKARLRRGESGAHQRWSPWIQKKEKKGSSPVSLMDFSSRSTAPLLLLSFFCRYKSPLTFSGHD